MRAYIFTAALSPFSERTREILLVFPVNEATAAAAFAVQHLLGKSLNSHLVVFRGLQKAGGFSSSCRRRRSGSGGGGTGLRFLPTLASSDSSRLRFGFEAPGTAQEILLLLSLLLVLLLLLLQVVTTSVVRDRRCGRRAEEQKRANSNAMDLLPVGRSRGDSAGSWPSVRMDWRRCTKWETMFCAGLQVSLRCVLKSSLRAATQRVQRSSPAKNCA
jgi:hypothetical protein